ncbi:MAG: ATP-binding protein [Acidimicrobiales bacterium]
MNIQIRLCLPQDAETVAVVRSVALAALVQMGVTPDCIDDIRLALSEACANVIEHAATDDYEVRLDVDSECCAISVIDAGQGVDVTTLPRTMPDPDSPRGRGIALMTALADSLDFSAQPDAGTMVRIVKRLSLTADGPLARLRRSQ